MKCKALTLRFCINRTAVLLSSQSTHCSTTVNMGSTSKCVVCNKMSLPDNMLSFVIIVTSGSIGSAIQASTKQTTGKWFMESSKLSSSVPIVLLLHDVKQQYYKSPCRHLQRPSLPWWGTSVILQQTPFLAIPHLRQLFNRMNMNITLSVLMTLKLNKMPLLHQPLIK